jgi:hypothetical protein
MNEGQTLAAMIIIMIGGTLILNIIVGAFL